MGEHPDRVFCVGALGVENILSQKLFAKSELEESIQFELGEKYCLVTFHPVTLEEGSGIRQVEELLQAMDEMTEYHYLITKANADAGGREINKCLEEFAAVRKEKVYLTESLGMVRYLSAMKYCSMVLGNSSSGILEAPAMRVPTVNIGDRQRGRIHADSIINCEPCCSSIKEAMRRAEEPEFRERVRKQVQPFGDGDTSRRIAGRIKEYLFKEDGKGADLKKNFYDIVFEI